ncbi:uncharacterized protein LOC135845518 [Planococcus citri]|uniref:uncharacterized protein LOC135845518 n=1 Tax=Planococcus citri TaxID=170843 RepID=UPI0031F9989C
MMSRSFAPLRIILTFMLVQTTTKARQLREPYSIDINSSLTCVLFGTTGCNIECSITHELYGHQTYGKCIGNNNCYCNRYYNINKPVELYDAWRKKFDDDYVFKQIIRYTSTIFETGGILADPEATGEENKESLKSILSPYQYARLKVNDRSLAAKFIKNGRVDMEPFKKHVSDELDEMLQYDTALLYKFYDDNFRASLNNINEAGTLYNFAYKVGRLQNANVEKIFKEYLRQNNIDKPEVNLKEEPLAMEVLHYTIINEMIKRNDAIEKSWWWRFWY